MAWTFYNASGEAMIEDGAMSIANNTNHRVVTATGADPASLDGEANLTFDGTNLTVGTGNLIIGTAGKGIDFAAQTATATGSMAAELLDHYEEGSFTPGITDTTADAEGDNESQGYGTQVGWYIRVGGVCHWWVRLVMNSLGTMTTGDAATLVGLPFTSKNTSSHDSAVNVARGGDLAISSGQSVTGWIEPNVARVILRLWDSATGDTNFLISELSADGSLTVSGSYEVA